MQSWTVPFSAINEDFLQSKGCRQKISGAQFRQLQSVCQAVCIIDGSRHGFLLGSNAVLTTRHGEQSPEQLSMMSVEFPKARGGAFTIEPSSDDGRRAFYVPGSDFDTSFPDMQLLIFPVLDSFSDHFDAAGVTPLWAVEGLSIPAHKRLLLVLHYVKSQDNWLEFMASALESLDMDDEFEDFMLVRLPVTRAGSSAAPLVVMALDDPLTIPVIGYMLGQYQQDVSTASGSSGDASNSMTHSNIVDRVFLSYKAMLKVLARLQMRLVDEEPEMGQADAYKSTQDNLAALAIPMERVKAVRLIPFTPRGRHCRGTAETTMCNMLIDAFDFGRVNDNKKSTLYHAGNIGPEAKQFWLAHKEWHGRDKHSHTGENCRFDMESPIDDENYHIQVQLGPFSKHGGSTASKSARDKHDGNSVAIVIAPVDPQGLPDQKYAENIKQALRNSMRKPEGQQVVDLRVNSGKAIKIKSGQVDKFIAKKKRQSNKY